MQIAPAAEATGTSSRLAPVPTEKRKRSTSPAASASGVASSTTISSSPKGEARAGRARRCERAHVVAALGEELERDRPDRARGADDTDARSGHGESVGGRAPGAARGRGFSLASGLAQLQSDVTRSLSLAARHRRLLRLEVPARSPPRRAPSLRARALGPPRGGPGATRRTRRRSARCPSSSGTLGSQPSSPRARPMSAT